MNGCTASTLDTATHVLGAVSLSAMLTIAAGSIMGGPHPVGLALRLWLFAAVYLASPAIVLDLDSCAGGP